MLNLCLETHHEGWGPWERTARILSQGTLGAWRGCLVGGLVVRAISHCLHGLHRPPPGPRPAHTAGPLDFSEQPSCGEKASQEGVRPRGSDQQGSGTAGLQGGEKRKLPVRGQGVRLFVS